MRHSSSTSRSLVLGSAFEPKARQRAKILDIRDALVRAGCLSLDAQSRALGLGRSTTYAILQASHKASGLSTHTLKTMLATPSLPPEVRARIVEYVQEKAAGVYGHNERQLRTFNEHFPWATHPPQSEKKRGKARA